MPPIPKGPKIIDLHFLGKQALELTIVFQIGLLGGTATATTRAVNGLPLPGLPLDVHPPRSRIEIFAGHQVVFRRAFSPPTHVEVYGGRPAWARLPFGNRQVLVTLIPAIPGATRVAATGPMGPWLQHALI